MLNEIVTKLWILFWQSGIRTQVGFITGSTLSHYATSVPQLFIIKWQYAVQILHLLFKNKKSNFFQIWNFFTSKSDSNLNFCSQTFIFEKLFYVLKEKNRKSQKEIFNMTFCFLFIFCLIFVLFVHAHMSIFSFSVLWYLFMHKIINKIKKWNEKS